MTTPRRRKLTKSQIVTGVATSVAILSSVAAKLLPFATLLGPVGPWLPVIIAVASAITAAYNQSLSPNHISLPTDVAIARGIINKQTQDLKGEDDEDITADKSVRLNDDTPPDPGV